LSDCADAARLGPDERLCEVAAVLAAGILRLRRRFAPPAESALENPATLSEALRFPRNRAQ
jgi:hypothetical protein